MCEAEETHYALGDVADTNPETLPGNTPRSAQFRYIELSAVEEGFINWGAVTETTFGSAPSRARRIVKVSDVLFGTVRPNLKSHGFIDLDEAEPLVASTGFSVVRARDGLSHPSYLFHSLMSSHVTAQAVRDAIGLSYPALNDSDVKRFQIFLPPYREQQKIAQILDTLDTAIHETEAIIAKLKAVKQGLLHDLLTRGIDANGELRPPQTEAPELYKESALGWIPKEWAAASLGDLAESLVDGPFGSNLKTAHYVESPGVRVVRLQNILSGEYDDSERAFISERHAMSLARNRVTAGDMLIASLGDANYPVGRSCCYPADLPDAINKADCFRFRSGSRCLNEFVMHSINGAAARKQVRGYEQGVTMKRINLGNLRRIEIALPPVPEQIQIVKRMAATQRQITSSLQLLQKLRHLKSGLMDDLLTGRVRVTPLLEDAAP